MGLEFIVLRKERLYLTVLLSIFTGGLFLLSFRFSIRFMRNFLYSATALGDASSIFVTNSDHSESIVKKKIHNGVIFFENRFLKYIFDAQKNQFRALEYDIEDRTCQDIIEESVYNMDF